MVQRGKNKQLFINMLASLITFAVGTGIGLLLTPYIVKQLGAEAYGFVGLSNMIISYAGLITIALNGMAGRFVALSYTRGEVELANRYYSSVFYANVLLAFVITLAFLGCTIWLEYIIQIPDKLIWDVKVLFALLALTNVFSMMTGIYGTACFIKNRLELSSIRTIVSQLIRAVVLIIAFGFFDAHVWYMGISGALCALYVFVTNVYLARSLTPDLRIDRRMFDWAKIKELVVSGVWNLITKIGDLLANGIDLLFANLFIGPEAMGVFALTKNIPVMIQSLMSTTGGVFGPTMLQIYAKEDTDALVREFKKSIRIMAMMSAIPLSLLYVFGEEFYWLWLPTQDSHWLYILTVAATCSMPLWQPLESLWQIFTLSNKVKYASAAVLINNGLTFLIAFFAMIFVDSPTISLLILAGTKNCLKFIMSITFLPIYAAKCIGTNHGEFYPTIIRYTFCFILICIIGFVIKHVVTIQSWITLIVLGIALSVISVFVNYVLMLTKSDRRFINNMINKFFRR